MDIPEIVGSVVGLITIVALVYTIYYGRKSQRKKLLVYENSLPITLAKTFSPEDEYRLSVLLQREGSSEERIESVYTTFLKFANLGKEPIRGSDIATANPIKVKVEGTRTLDIQVAGKTREVNKVHIVNQVAKDTEAEVQFDYLDYQDGGLVRILTVDDRGKISLSGDIIGMPEGIRNIEETDGDISVWKEIISIAAIVVLNAFVYYWLTGSWNRVWLAFVPWGVLILGIAISIIIAFTWPSGRPSFPKSLELPKWASDLFIYLPGMTPARRHITFKLEWGGNKEKGEWLKKEIDELQSKK